MTAESKTADGQDEWLRSRLPLDLRNFGYPMCDRAADEIERLRADLDAAKADIAMLIQKETEAVNGK